MLFPEAERGERVVVCLRKSRAWGLTRGRTYPGTLFAPYVNAAGYMNKGSQRNAIIRAARSALSLPHDEALMSDVGDPVERFGWSSMDDIRPLKPDGTPMNAEEVQAIKRHHEENSR
ncbi:hypothetical protein P7D22_14045 [Lichenihabitans sp. Uapishka_5]|uniref:hypothetical protein n=1 Tax=Lichenihabitans sp. Uapishka_5 TaxID=3037302 RepID=UPI0029E7E86D|nr:hypothetical protein [Lichenihabitans sp. Uapishka_5]MDX7952293.1 hypothetical protein [Lichenihabitans sp. Uapishka_5]